MEDAAGVVERLADSDATARQFIADDQNFGDDQALSSRAQPWSRSCRR